MKLDVGVANETARKSVNAENPQFTTMRLSKKSDIFVGGVPSGKSIPKGIPSNSFIGCADRISIDNEVKGLWNWKVEYFQFLTFYCVPGYMLDNSLISNAVLYTLKLDNEVKGMWN